MFNRTFGGSLLLAVLSCASVQAAPIVVPKPVPYADDNEIASKIKSECTINVQLADYIAEFAKGKSIETRFADSVSEQDQGRVLVIEIRDAISEGNAWMGHAKSTSVQGELYEDGQMIGSFRARRNSMGGAFPGFKGSCSVLGRTVKALGKDIAEWMAAPTMEARLGDL